MSSIKNTIRQEVGIIARQLDSSLPSSDKISAKATEILGTFANWRAKVANTGKGLNEPVTYSVNSKGGFSYGVTREMLDNSRIVIRSQSASPAPVSKDVTIEELA